MNLRLDWLTAEAVKLAALIGFFWALFAALSILMPGRMPV